MPHDEPDHPRWLVNLRREVDRAFVVTGASTPGWADPYPDHDPPDEAYSQCEDPSRYRILDSRVDAWVQVLADRGLATAVEVEPGDADLADGYRPRSDLLRVRRLEPAASGGLSVVVATTLVDGAPFGLDVGIADRVQDGAWIEPVPDCGCDACDRGSADLIEVLDGWVMTVARGGVVHVSDGGTRMTRTWDGWRGTGTTGESWLDDPASAPPSATVWRGGPWSLRPRSAP